MKENNVKINWQTRMELKPGVTLSLDDISFAGRLIDVLKDLSGTSKSIMAMKDINQIAFFQGNNGIPERVEKIRTEVFEAIKDVLLQDLRQKTTATINKLEKMGLVISLGEEEGSEEK